MELGRTFNSVDFIERFIGWLESSYWNWIKGSSQLNLDFFQNFELVEGASTDSMANTPAPNNLSPYIAPPEATPSTSTTTTTTTAPLTALAPLSTNSSPSHGGGSSSAGHTLMPLVNSGSSTAMLLERNASIMSPDSEEDTYHLGLSHHQPFKKEVQDGIENAYA